MNWDSICVFCVKCLEDVKVWADMLYFRRKAIKLWQCIMNRFHHYFCLGRYLEPVMKYRNNEPSWPRSSVSKADDLHSWGRRFDSHCNWTKCSTSPVWFSLRVALWYHIHLSTITGVHLDIFCFVRQNVCHATNKHLVNCFNHKRKKLVFKLYSLYELFEKRLKLIRTILKTHNFSVARNAI